MLRIGEFSKLARTTVKTLRYYDEMGLLKPSEVDGWSGYRYYATPQLYPLQRIVALRQAGLSVDEVKRILAGQNVAETLAARKVELEHERAEAEDRLSRLSCIIQQMEEDHTMQHQAIVKQIPACVVYSREGMVHSYADITPFIEGAHAECHAANPNLSETEPPYSFMNYLDGEYREAEIRLRFSQAVKEMGRDTANVHFEKLPAIDAVCVYHKGPYDQLGQAYALRSTGWNRTVTQSSARCASATSTAFGTNPTHRIGSPSCKYPCRKDDHTWRTYPLSKVKRNSTPPKQSRR